MASGYKVPDLPLFDASSPGGKMWVRFEEEIKRSRFITTLARADSRERALALVDCVRKEFPDARHHCFAYAAGRPGETAKVGQSDDGEPHGTAGRPMLSQLLYGGVGEVAAVTTRYFGGIKLGTGGLTRAYQNGVKEALALLPVTEKKVFLRARARVDYAHADRFYRLLPRFQAKVAEESFGESALFTLELPEECFEACRLALRECTDGMSELVPAEEKG
ncbi:YigZ family protein [Mailhella massiliensis]|uniref:YigZ family protein n=1 Tax=Mailhella massiliensis TaxID=1903261 RepID=A0A921AWG9_9BACT|nr:YigZ family protein [Mailhella massiliensis]HJD97139.1 YigZ family protein [Mailhella massiliensis]